MACQEPGRPDRSSWLDLVQTLCQTGRFIEECIFKPKLSIDQWRFIIAGMSIFHWTMVHLGGQDGHNVTDKYFLFSLVTILRKKHGVTFTLTFFCILDTKDFGF